MSLILSGTDGLSDVDGSAATPAVRGTDANTGIFFPAADTIAFSEGGVEAVRIDSAGNVGIGTTNTTDQRLKIKQSADTGAASFSFKVEANANDTGLYIGYRGVGAATAADTCAITATYGSTGGYKPITFLTSDAERMRIDSSGNLLVGATSTILSAKQTIAFFTGSNGLTISTTDNINNTDFAIFRANGATCGTVSRVGTTAAVNYVAISDYRLKNVIGTVTGHGERIDALKPIHYEWKDGGASTSGFLAHEFQEIYANSVTGTKDNVDKDGKPVYQGMQASSAEVIADLVAEIQSLRKRLTALEQA